MITLTDIKDVKGKQYFTVDIDGTQIIDCKLMDGKNGQFVSGPARSFQAKDGTTKWVNLVSFSKADTSEILAILIGNVVPVIDVDEDDIPF